MITGALARFCVAASFDIGALVLDLAMPELDGMELQDRLATAGNPMPIIFLTGLATEDQLTIADFIFA